eukprot:CAMPEP_0196802562 /NCGR_PEP_ID=MMETSP1362-20130617/2154_1 /TAXON_ID=163516 /ORGANISM="Leptocylindrus danicus, Strain CCMP1856" /LENGTH=192 /DNA_ID=CAMNT_0042173891 /DNA_START=288 /DNA_END=866 /DNA_ORIENTATION=+
MTECPQRMLLCDVNKGLVGKKIRLMGVVVSRQTQQAEETTTMITLDDGTALVDVKSRLGGFTQTKTIKLGDTVDCVGTVLMSTGSSSISLSAEYLSIVVDLHAETLRQLEIIQGSNNYISRDENYAMSPQNLFRLIQSAIDVDNRGLSQSELTVLLGIHRDDGMIAELHTTLQQMQADGEIYVDSDGGFVPL